MTPLQSRHFKIGLFVLAGTGLAVAGLILLGLGALFQKQILVETYFDSSVQGLEVGSPVKWRGIQIGSVHKIEALSSLYPVPSPYVAVIMNVTDKRLQSLSEKDIQERVKEDVEAGLRFRLSYQGLTGAAFLEADYFDPDYYQPLPTGRWTPLHPYIPSVPSTFTQLSESLSRITQSIEKMDLAKVIGNIESIMASLDKTLGGLKVDEVTQEARMLLAEVRETNRLIQTTIQTTTDAGLLKDASATVAGVRRIVENAEKPVAGSVASLQSAAGRLDRAGKNLGPALERLPKVLDQIQATLQRLDQLAAAPQAGWSESMDNLKTISDNLRKLTEDLRQDPARLLLEPRPGPVRPGGGHGR